jgi:RHS repeat-associated protein
MKKVLLIIVSVLFAFQVNGQDKNKKNKKDSIQSGNEMNSMFVEPIDPPPGGGNTYPWNRDMDGDGYGDPNIQVESETKPAGYVSNNSDCDDTDPYTYPGAPELADGKDNDCDGSIDEGISAPAMPATPSITNYCGYTRLTRGAPPTGVTWYWQSTSSGTSTSNSSVYIDRTSGTVYYLRARNNSSALWSTARTVNYTITTCAINPINESFEVGLGGWIQETGDTMDWTRRTGSTPSAATGPAAAFNGSYYMFTESSGFNNKTAQFTSPTYNITSNLNFNFNYHMYGATMGSLTLQVSTNGGSGWSQLWTASGDKGNVWLSASVGLSAYLNNEVLIRFVGVTGSSYTSDISIDNITFTAAPIAGPTQLSDENYVYNRIYRTPMSTSPVAPNREDVIEDITYFDGLGRPKQHVGIQQGAGAGLEDLVTYMGYDEFGRQAKSYLPYPEFSTNPGTIKTGDVVLKTQNYYLGNNGDDFPGLTAANTNPYSETRFEASPLNRVLEQGAPGKDWEVLPTSDLDHTVKFEYKTNAANEVRLYNVSLTSAFVPSLIMTTYYTAGELFKSVTKDENWTTGVNNTTEEFKDKQGRVILKRTYNAGVAHDTYYVYDDYGNLTYVLPPKSEPQSAKPDVTELAELCYQYKYDKRNRLVEKKIPGKNVEFIVYNELDQPILTQDANLKASGKWLYTKYDAFGRVISTGLFTNSSATQPIMQAIVDTFYEGGANAWEDKTTTSTYNYYTSQSYPTTGIEVLTLNYYDNYTFDTAGLKLNAGTLIFDDYVEYTTKGLPTGSRVKVLGESTWITSLLHYDDKGRVIYTASNNAFLENIDKVKQDLDFMGNVGITETTHTKGTMNIVTVDNYEYDHVNRLLKQTQQINGGATEVIANNTYDKLGQLVSKGVGNTDGNSRLQTVDYAYNVRGWLKTINNPTTSLGIDLFGFKLNYNTKELGSTNANLYNGNISETIWKTANDVSSNKTRGYAYSYDALNRITYADYGIKTTGSYNLGSGYDMQINVYDKNGNIRDLTRYGASGEIDQLTYNYFNNEVSNKLLKVGDAINGTEGFNNGSTGNDYTYDLNGNMTSDANKGIPTNGITYNHLNLPTSVNLPGGTISYIYDAKGVKQKKIVPGKETQYAGNYIYEKIGVGSPLLQFFNHPEGYVNLEGGVYKYVYNYKDHLGNVRLSYTDANGNGTIETGSSYSEIVEENNYYPFGLKHLGYNSNSSSLGSSAAKKYKFQGVELEEALGLNLYEMDFRQYDPAIARFTSIDPVIHHSMSPYMAFDGNPVFWADPSGADATTDLWGRNKFDSNGTYIAPYARAEASSDNMPIKNEEFIQMQPGKIDFVNTKSEEEKEKFKNNVIDWFGYVDQFGNRLLSVGSIIDFYAEPKEKNEKPWGIAIFDAISGSDIHEVTLEDGKGNFVEISYNDNIKNYASLYSGTWVEPQGEETFVKGVKQNVYRINMRSHNIGSGNGASVISMLFTGKDKSFYNQIYNRIKAYEPYKVKITPYKKQ